MLLTGVILIIEGTNASKFFVWCLCMYVLCLWSDWFCRLTWQRVDVIICEKSLEMCIFLWRVFDCPEVTLCSWQDIKIQSLLLLLLPPGWTPKMTKLLLLILKSGADQNIASHALPTARSFFVVLISTFHHFFFSKSSFYFLAVSFGWSTFPYMGPHNKIIILLIVIVTSDFKSKFLLWMSTEYR